MPRFVLAGNNLAAVHVLDLLLEVVPIDSVLVIAPDPSSLPAWQESLARHATSLGVECLTPVDVNEADVAEHVARHNADVFLSVYYTQIFRGRVMSVIRGKAVNFHPSLLPLHRGNAPLIWSIVDGDRLTGLTVHHIDAGIDTGNVILQRQLPIHDNDTGYVLHRKMANLVRATAAELIRGAIAGIPLPPGQQQSGAYSYHSSRDPRVNHIVWTEPRRRIRDIVRALAPPLPGAFAIAGDTNITLARVDYADAGGRGTPKAPGMVEIASAGPPIVWAADGPLHLTAVVVDGAPLPGRALVESGLLLEGQVLS